MADRTHRPGPEDTWTFVLTTPDAVIGDKFAAVVDILESQGLRSTMCRIIELNLDLIRGVYGGGTQWFIGNPGGEGVRFSLEFHERLYGVAPACLVMFHAAEGGAHQRALGVKGRTWPEISPAGTVRHLGENVVFNLIHSPDDPSAAWRELRVLVGADEAERLRLWTGQATSGCWTCSAASGSRLRAGLPRLGGDLVPGDRQQAPPPGGAADRAGGRRPTGRGRRPGYSRGAARRAARRDREGDRERRCGPAGCTSRRSRRSSSRPTTSRSGPTTTSGPSTAGRRTDRTSRRREGATAMYPSQTQGPGSSGGERPVREVWEAVFGRAVDGDSDFFELGGDSLPAIQITTGSNSACGRTTSSRGPPSRWRGSPWTTNLLSPVPGACGRQARPLPSRRGLLEVRC